MPGGSEASFVWSPEESAEVALVAAHPAIDAANRMGAANRLATAIRAATSVIRFLCMQFMGFRGLSPASEPNLCIALNVTQAPLCTSPTP